MDINNEPKKVVIEEDGGWQALKYYRQPEPPKVITLIMKYSGGVVKNHKQAEYVLLGLTVLAIIISIFLFSSAGAGVPTPISSYESLLMTPR
ncbi:MAG: hypothetical protein AAB719_01345 [Patescibacteria group bacterium]